MTLSKNFQSSLEEEAISSAAAAVTNKYHLCLIRDCVLQTTLEVGSMTKPYLSCCPFLIAKQLLDM
jgi:hypothetical protein